MLKSPGLMASGTHGSRWLETSLLCISAFLHVGLNQFLPSWGLTTTIIPVKGVHILFSDIANTLRV